MQCSSKNIYILFFLLSLSATAQNSWYYLNPDPTGNPILSVDFINSDTGYAVGAKGTVVKSVDKGASWHTSANFTTYDLYDVTTQHVV